MRKIFFLLLILLLSCSRNQIEQRKDYIVASNYPLKLIIQEITGDTGIVHCLVPPGISPHLFEPKVSDIQKLENSKVVFYASNELEGWLTKNIQNKIALISLLPKDKVKLMPDGKTLDPHFWTDPMTVYSLVDTLTNVLATYFPQSSNKFIQNAQNFKNKLIELDKELQELLAPVKNRYVFLYHPSFLYLISRYGFNYGGSIEEIPGSEPTPSQISKLVQKIQETKTKAIFSEPQLNNYTAKTVAEMAGVELYELDPLGSGEIKSYSELILKNAKTLVEALK